MGFNGRIRFARLRKKAKKTYLDLTDFAVVDGGSDSPLQESDVKNRVEQFVAQGDRSGPVPPFVQSEHVRNNLKVNAKLVKVGRVFLHQIAPIFHFRSFAQLFDVVQIAVVQIFVQVNVAGRSYLYESNNFKIFI
jgi:hypothetical protein